MTNKMQDNCDVSLRKSDKEAVMAAVLNSGTALEFASDDLKANIYGD